MPTLKVWAETKFSVRSIPRPENFVRDANWTCLLKFGLTFYFSACLNKSKTSMKYVTVKNVGPSNINRV